MAGRAAAWCRASTARSRRAGRWRDARAGRTHANRRSRSAVEHVFARQKGPMALVVRTIGIARARPEDRPRQSRLQHEALRLAHQPNGACIASNADAGAFRPQPATSSPAQLDREPPANRANANRHAQINQKSRNWRCPAFRSSCRHRGLVGPRARTRWLRAGLLDSHRGVRHQGSPVFRMPQAPFHGFKTKMTLWA